MHRAAGFCSDPEMMRTRAVRLSMPLNYMDISSSSFALATVSTSLTKRSVSF